MHIAHASIAPSCAMAVFRVPVHPLEMIADQKWRSPFPPRALMTLAFVWSVRRNSRQQAEAAAALRDEREQLRVTLASIGDGVIVTDPTGKVTMLNGVAEQLTGWSQGEAAGTPLEHVFSIVNEDTREAVTNPVIRALRDGVIVGLANTQVGVDIRQQGQSLVVEFLRSTLPRRSVGLTTSPV